MLSNNPGDSTAVDTSAMPVDMMTSPLLSDVGDPVQELLDVLASPEFRDADSFDMDSFLTSPLYDTPLLDFATSPNDDSPLSDYLTTPLIQDDSNPIIGSDDYAALPLFPEMPMSGGSLFGGFTNPVENASMDKLYKMSSPSTPALNSVDPTTVYPSPPVSTLTSFTPVAKPSRSSPATRTESLAARRAGVTGTRKNLQPEALVPLDAPTQSRHYALPSATSRKEVPAVFSRKRARSQAFGNDEDDELNEAPLPPNATEREQIEWKRRQNTLAARKSRKRKLEHQQYLEGRVESLEREVEMWRTRTETMQSILRSHGIPVAEFPATAE